MKRVCHMTSAHDPEDVRIFGKECVSLARAGYETYLVESGESYEKDGVHIVGVGEIPTSRRKRMTEGAKRVYSAAKAIDADLYHFHDPELLPYGLKLKHAGKAVIFDSHECYKEQLRYKPYLSPWVASVIAKAYGVYEQYALRRLDAVIFPCTMGGKNPFAGRCRRAAIISNAAILDEFYDRYDAGCSKKPRQVCYVGGLTEERGITSAVKAAPKADAVLALAGTFSSVDYESQLRAMPEFSHVDVRGRLNRVEVSELLNESCVGLCALLNQGQYLKIDTFGIKVYEYLSEGLPVILSHSAYNDRMVEKYGFGICATPDDPDDIARAIKYILDHPDEAKQMGANGRKAIKEEFNWSVEEKKLLSLYENILGE